MLEIRVPKTFKKERTYIIDILLKEYLGLHIEIVFHEANDYIINLPNKNSLTIRDHFFSNKFPNDNYLDIQNLPQKVLRTINPFIVEEDIPVIYGSEEFYSNTNMIICGIDIFASSFFMLTRWEEHVNKERDTHNRFPATASIAYKNNFLDRPVVNEYVEMIWGMLKHLGLTQERKKRVFQFINTHDVDHLRRWNNSYQVLKTVGGDFLKRRDILLAKNRINEYIKIKTGKLTDPYDTFDWLMDQSELKNIQSRFYFMSGGLTKFDNHYQIDEERSLKIINVIKERGHVIGFHPSYNSYKNPEQWKIEKTMLEKTIDMKISEGRQHYLRFQAPYTWQIWEDNGMVKDLTLSYADKEGFRCGTCYEYPVFNFLTRMKLNLIESPLIVMEGSFFTYQNLSLENMNVKIKNLIKKVKKYNGQFVFLWHNSCFPGGLNTPLADIYIKALKEI